jgi:hypothetical protein
MDWVIVRTGLFTHCHTLSHCHTLARFLRSPKLSELQEWWQGSQEYKGGDREVRNTRVVAGKSGIQGWWQGSQEYKGGDREVRNTRVVTG